MNDSRGGYGAVPPPPSEPGGGKQRQVNSLPPPLFVAFFGGAEDDARTTPREKQQQEQPDDHDGHADVNERGFAADDGGATKLEFKVASEAWRFLAYLFFWAMCFFAIIMTKVFVAPSMAAGPQDSDSSKTCPPFEPNGEGFDVFTDSHLRRAFGFNNICVNWDYTPSREATAMVYPLFEYSLLIYLLLDFTNSAISYKKGYVSSRYWALAKILFPIQVVLCAWFRMIFVMIVYESVQGHTAGFLGLQLALIIVALTNVLYILETKPEYRRLGGVAGTRRLALAYIACDLAISGVKVYLTCYVVFLAGGYPGWALAPSGLPGKNVGQVVDIIWMFFNAILPLVISFVRARSEKAMTFTIDLPPAPTVIARQASS